MDTSRPSKDKQFHPPRTFTDDVIKLILKDIKAGSPKRHAAEANGIAESTFHTAIKQGITDIVHGDPESRWARLVVSLRAIEQEEIQYCRQAIKGSDKGHKGAEWTLEHAYWRDFCADAKLIELANEVENMKREMQSNQSNQSDPTNSEEK